jgi:hypothetical protein
MRIKDIKITLFSYLPYECVAVEEYLEEMAKRGWLLQSVKGYLFKFKRIEPKKIKYSVDVLYEASIFDCKDSNAALEYREYCKAAGWNYVCQTGKIQIFYTDDDRKNISIHTDEEEKYKSVLKASLNNVGWQFILTLILILDLYMFLFNGSIDYVLASDLMISSMLIMLALIFINSIEIISFFIWVIKAKGHLKENKFMPYNNYKQLRIKNIFKNTYILIILLVYLVPLIFNNDDRFNISFLLIIMCIPLIIEFCIEIFINRKRYSRKTNMAIHIGSVIVSIYLIFTVVGISLIWSITGLQQSKFTTKKISLRLSDFGYKEKKDTIPNINFDKSILAQRTEYYYGNENNNLSYTIFHSQYSWVIEFDENRLLRTLKKYGRDLKLENTNLPSNIKVYSDSNKKIFVLVSKDKVVEITKGFSGISENEFLNKAYKNIF